MTETPEDFDVCKARVTTAAASRAAALFLGASVVTSVGCGEEASLQNSSASATTAANAAATSADTALSSQPDDGGATGVPTHVFRAVPPYSPVPVRERDCDPPFTLDAKGKKTPKPYCQ